MKYIGTGIAFAAIALFVVTCWLTWAICWWWGTNDQAVGFWICGAITSAMLFAVGCIVYSGFEEMGK